MDFTSAIPIRQILFAHRATTGAGPATTRFSQPLQEFLPDPADFLPKSIASPDLLFISPPHRLGANIAHAVLGNRLTVDPRTLTPLVLVRIQVPQPISLDQDIDEVDPSAAFRADLMAFPCVRASAFSKIRVSIARKICERPVQNAAAIRFRIGPGGQIDVSLAATKERGRSFLLLRLARIAASSH